MKRIDTGHYEGTMNGKTVSVVSLASASVGESKERGWVAAVDGNAFDVFSTKADAIAACERATKG